MIRRTATIRNAQGIHCRPSAVIIKETQQYACTMKVSAGKNSSDCRSIMGLLTLGLHEGMCVDIEVSGPGEAEVCDRLVELFETHFDFPPRQPGEADDEVLESMA